MQGQPPSAQQGLAEVFSYLGFNGDTQQSAGRDNEPLPQGKEARMDEGRDVVIDLRLDDERPARVYLAPEGRDLPFEVYNGAIRTTVPRARGHALVVFET